MLNHFGKVFFKLSAGFDVDGVRAITADIRISGRSVGELRYNYDRNYNSDYVGKNEIRVSFDMEDIKVIDPVTNYQTLEDLVVGCMVWPIKDNFHIWESPQIYIVVHGYMEDNTLVNSINSAILGILKNLGAVQDANHKDKWILTSTKANNSLISNVIRRTYS